MGHKKFYFTVGMLLVVSLFLTVQTTKLNAVEEKVEVTLSRKTKLITAAPLVHQSTTYSCGAASLQSVLAYYDVEMNESDLQKELGTTQEGTGSEKIVEVAEGQGLKVVQKYNSTVEDIKKHLNKKQLVIVEFQAWQDETRKVSYKDDWESGHYAVVIGMDKKNIYMMDPSLLGSRGVLPITEFLERWHDTDSKKVKKYQNAIFFEGTIAPPPEWQKID
jgi:predicted double-glycine peptidase